MVKVMKTISLAEAREIAGANAFSQLKEFGATNENVLAEKHLEAPNCWMFFVNEELNIPIEHTLGIKWAYVVSKKGKFSMVQDYSDDKQMLEGYLKRMSDYFLRRGE